MLWSCQPRPSPVSAASKIRLASRMVPYAIWKNPGRYAGLDASVIATATSGEIEKVRVSGS